MEEETVMSFTSKFPETKGQQDYFIARLVESITEGNEDPLKAWVLLKSMEQVIKKVLADKSVREAALNEADKYGEKTFNFRNARITVKEGRPTYDYSASEDWKAAKAEAELANEALKAIEKRLQTASPKAPYVDIISGLEITAIPKSSETQIAVEFNKQ